MSNIPYRQLIYDAINNNNDFVVANCYYKGISLNGDDNNFKKSFLYYALKIKNYFMAGKLIQYGAKVNYKTDSFLDSVIYAALYIPESNCYCIKRPKTEQINFVKFLLHNCNLPLIFKDSTFLINKNTSNYASTAYQYAIEKFYPEDICEFIYHKAKLQGSKDVNVTKKIKTNTPDNTRNDFTTLDGYNYNNYILYSNYF